jgi:DNA invertase Pin-like site-specific DNA recombinase
VVAPRDRDDDLAQAMVAAARHEVGRSRRSRARPAAAVVGYVRVSTEEQGDVGAGLEAQRLAIRAACAARRWSLMAIHQDVASGRSLERRPGLADALAAIAAGEASGLVVAKLDRLSRSVIDAAQTIEQARREGWNLVALDLGVDFSTAAGEAMAHMTAVFAQLERRLIGERTRAALAVKRAQGVRLGRPPELSPRVRRRIVGLRQRGAGWTAIAEQLNRDHVPTAHGGSRWYPATVRAVVMAAASKSRVGS